MSLSTDQSLPENKRKEKKDEAIAILKQGITANPSRSGVVSKCVLHC